MLTFVMPKGRIADEALPLLRRADIIPEQEFFNDNTRQLKFATSDSEVQIVRVRSFDAATYMAYGVAEWGIVGSDVLAEHDYDGLYAPIDLGIGKCRLSVAAKRGVNLDDLAGSVRVATKYPNVTRQFFAARGIQAECIKLLGAMELAPQLGLCDIIVDLVSSGETLKANDLVELETIMPVSSRLVLNRVSYKTLHAALTPRLEKFNALLDKKAA